jgi:hypothetical protein
MAFPPRNPVETYPIRSCDSTILPLHVKQSEQCSKILKGIEMLVISAALAISAATLGSAQSQEIIIMGGRSQDQFLGCISCSEYDSNSVFNQYGTHGWSNKYGTWNRYGEHAGRYGSNSACNQYGTNSPILVDRRGNYYGRLTVNEYQSGSVCGPNGVEQVCRALRVMCADT